MLNKVTSLVLKVVVLVSLSIAPINFIIIIIVGIDIKSCQLRFIADNETIIKLVENAWDILKKSI